MSGSVSEDRWEWEVGSMAGALAAPAGQEWKRGSRWGETQSEGFTDRIRQADRRQRQRETEPVGTRSFPYVPQTSLILSMILIPVYFFLALSPVTRL